MVGLRRETLGLAHERRNMKLTVLQLILSAMVFFVAAAGLGGILIFSCIHWSTFS